MRNIIRGLTLVAAGACGSTMAQSAQLYSFDIDRQSLGRALTELSRQTGFQVGLFIAGKEEGESVIVGPLKGRYTIENALDKVLDGSGITYTRVNEITISVTPQLSGQARTSAR